MSLTSLLSSLDHYCQSPARLRRHARKVRRLQKKLAIMLALLSLAGVPVVAHALPQNGQVVAGQAGISQNGNTMTIQQQSNNAIINWNSFNIGQNEALHHNMPSAQSAGLHRVTGTGSSELAGLLRSNGNVFLVNPNGVYIHKGARIETGGFVATTRDILNDDFMAGRYRFNIAGKAGASVINEGSITVRDFGFAALVAPTVRNNGLIAAKLGKIALGSGQAFTLDLFGDDLIRFHVTNNDADNLYTPQGERLGVTNNGTIKAEGGIVLLTASQLNRAVVSSINNAGLVSAASATQQGGKIVFSAVQGDVQNSGRVDASGATAGGTVRMVASGDVNVSGSVMATGRGHGGVVDISGQSETVLSGATVDASGAIGGSVRLGGAFQGGENKGGVDASQRYGFAGRFNHAALASTQRLLVDGASVIAAGPDGTIVGWSDGRTSVNGSWTAKWLETSGQSLYISEQTVANGHALWLLDPYSIRITTQPNASDLPSPFPDNINNEWLGKQKNVSIVAFHSITFHASVRFLTSSAVSFKAGESIRIEKGVTLSREHAGDNVLKLTANSISFEKGSNLTYDNVYMEYNNVYVAGRIIVDTARFKPMSEMTSIVIEGSGNKDYYTFNADFIDFSPYTHIYVGDYGIMTEHATIDEKLTIKPLSDVATSAHQILVTDKNLGIQPYKGVKIKYEGSVIPKPEEDKDPAQKPEDQNNLDVLDKTKQPLDYTKLDREELERYTQVQKKYVEYIVNTYLSKQTDSARDHNKKELADAMTQSLKNMQWFEKLYGLYGATDDLSALFTYIAGIVDRKVNGTITKKEADILNHLYEMPEDLSKALASNFGIQVNIASGIVSNITGKSATIKIDNLVKPKIKVTDFIKNMAKDKIIDTVAGSVVDIGYLAVRGDDAKRNTCTDLLNTNGDYKGVPFSEIQKKIETAKEQFTSASVEFLYGDLSRGVNDYTMLYGGNAINKEEQVRQGYDALNYSIAALAQEWYNDNKDVLESSEVSPAQLVRLRALTSQAFDGRN